MSPPPPCDSCDRLDMTKVDKEAYKNSLDKLTEVLTGIARHADEQSTYRCPYKNRHDECTAKIGCRNQRKPKTEGDC